MTELTTTELKSNIDRLVTEISENHFQMGRKMVQLGSFLMTVKNSRAWHDWGFETFGQYIESLQSRVDRSRMQLFAYKSIAETLLPLVPEDRLEKMGINKALVLKSAVKSTGKSPSAELIDKATSKITTEEFEGVVAEEYGFSTVNEPGTYYSLGGFKVTAEEKKELEYAFSVAERVSPPISKELSHSARMKEIILNRFAREFLSQYAEPVEKGQA